MGLLPLGPITNMLAESVSDIIQEMDRRFQKEIRPDKAGELWTVGYSLLGLKYDDVVAHQLVQGVHEIMQESSTYQAILKKGESLGFSKGEKRGEKRGEKKNARKNILFLGEQRFGAPDTKTRETIETITSIDRLEKMVEHILEVSSWQELLTIT